MENEKNQLDNSARSNQKLKKKLWLRLRDRQLDGLKFRRQVPIGPYFADFCCMDQRIIIELDGYSHVGAGEADASRTCYLKEQGFRVLRFWNTDVISHIDIVCKRILDELKKGS